MKKFKKALGASIITSILLVLDRIVVNAVPLYFWGAELAGVWIFLRSWGFLLSSFEGGAGGRLSNWLSRQQSPDEKAVENEYIKVSAYQLVWGGAVFLIHACVVMLIGEFDLLWFSLSDHYDSFLLIGVYSILYYQSQLISYKLKGLGLVFEGQMIVNGIKFLEVISCLLLPAAGVGIFGTIASVVVIRLVAVLWVGKPRLGSFNYSKIHLNFSYFLYPLVPAVNNFMPIVIVGVLFGNSAIAAFSISKMFGMLLVQFSQVLTRVLWPSLAAVEAPRERILMAWRTIKKYTILVFILLFLMLSASTYLSGYEYNGVVLNKELIFALCLWAYFSAYSDVFLSVFISFEVHLNSLILRLLVGFMPAFFVFFDVFLDISMYVYSLVVLEFFVFCILSLNFYKLYKRYVQ